MLRGFATITYVTDDIPAAVAWYTELLGVEPYFRNPEDGPPAYVEFRIGDHQDELGLLDSRFAPQPRSTTPGGAVTFWHVDDVTAAVDRMVAMGATLYEPITPRSAGFVTASVVDPFGNVIGVMYNPHYLEVLGKVGSV